MWDLPGPGLEPVSPALAGGFLTTAPPGKSQESILMGGRGAYREVSHPRKDWVEVHVVMGCQGEISGEGDPSRVLHLLDNVVQLP